MVAFEISSPRTAVLALRLTPDEAASLEPFFETFASKSEGMRWLLGTQAVQQLMKLRIAAEAT